MKKQDMVENRPPIFHYPSIQKAGKKLIESRENLACSHSEDSDLKGIQSKPEIDAELKGSSVPGRKRLVLSAVNGFFSRLAFRVWNPGNAAFFDPREMEKFRIEKEMNQQWPNILIR
jgi:hypothetical protein